MRRGRRRQLTRRRPRRHRLRTRWRRWTEPATAWARSARGFRPTARCWMPSLGSYPIGCTG